MTRPIPTHVPFWRTGPARCVLVIVVAVVLAQMVGCNSRGTSDELGGQGFSGDIIRARMDPLTGCQYITYREGGITPRMDRDGKQVCALVGAK